jgi:hypothetical protein
VAVARRRTVPDRGDVWVLGLLAGLMYGAGGIGARVLRTPSTPWRIVLDPALWTIVAAGLLGLLLYAMAVQRGPVTVATAAVTVAETVMPAAVGLTFLGDSLGRGQAVVAVTGFVFAVAGTVTLARHAEAPTTPALPATSHAAEDVAATCPS